MSKKGVGMTTVLADGKLAGIVTDGDLRRLMQKRREETFALTAAQVMTREPVTIGPDEFTGAALTLMAQRNITCVVVIESDRRVVGVLHFHDLWPRESS
jgi:arabinose-5-phosphate isomerase